jgi:hypothetical protein
MSTKRSDDIALDVLNPGDNIGYLPKPIPTIRDRQIEDLLLQSIADHSLATLSRRLTDGHGMVLRVFAERMASSAVRYRSQEQLRVGLIALLLGLGRADSREGLLVFPLFFDAMIKLSIVPLAFGDSVRQVVGDRLWEPFGQFMHRSDKSLKAMGYQAGTDGDGFRYLRDW